MHVQRALELDQPPAFLVCTDVNDLRLRDLEETFAGEALAKGAQLRCLNPQRPEHAKELAACRVSGFDDVIILAPAAAVISECFGYLAPGGVMNIFAGVERGTLATLDLSAVAGKQARIIGQSGSTIDDLRKVLELVEKRKLSTNRSVAAIGSLSAARDGLRAVMETRYPGKVVLFPHLRDLPLTPLPDLKDRLPRVFAKLKDGREWTLEAEAELLREMLKDRSAPEQKSGAGELF
jgi:threonine dehydrogenase-like Zn-dependent dehydrogenase